LCNTRPSERQRMTILKGQVDVIWNEDYKNFSYTKQPLTDQELKDWRLQGYTHSSFSGAMYGGKKPMPDWTEAIAQQLSLKKTGYVFYKMTTNDIMPVHVDHFRRYCDVFSVYREDVWRAILFLEDWKSGHYFEIDNHAFCNYKKGEFVMWSADVPHAASNIGVEDRYTLQITGIR